MSGRPFSSRLEAWLKDNSHKTINSLTNIFAEKSFAIIILVLMFLPALPLPTGGITHVFELIVMVLAVELMIGRGTVWLPPAWQNKRLGSFFQRRTIPIIIARIKWFERFSRPRWTTIMNHRYFGRLVGLLFFIFALGAFLAPPFAGLDTLPALGAVMVALSLILEDIVIFAAGLVIGAVGVALVIGTGALTIQFFTRLLH